MFLSLLLLPAVLAKEKAKRSQYISVTTMHGNMDPEYFNIDQGIAVEKEYLDQVTSNNQYLIGASFYIHQITPDNTEVLYVQL